MRLEAVYSERLRLNHLPMQDGHNGNQKRAIKDVLRLLRVSKVGNAVTVSRQEAMDRSTLKGDQEIKNYVAIARCSQKFDSFPSLCQFRRIT